MIIILGLYAVLIWLIFFQFKVLPWNWLSKTAVALIGVAILFTFMGLLNSRTPSGRVAIMSPVVSIAAVVNGTIVEIPVQTYQAVKNGDALFKLDKRPFEFAVQQAEANFKIAEVSYKRVITAVEKNPATFSRQKVDEIQAAFEVAQATLEVAKYNLDRTTVVAAGDGVIGSVRLRVGDKVPAFKPVLPMIRTGEARLWGVFQQNGQSAIQVGSDVGISFASEPGVVRWTKILEIAPGTSGGQVSASANLLGQGDTGNSSEVLVWLEWPKDVPRDSVNIGYVGSATVIGPKAGAIGGLAKILLSVKAFVQYL
jgi:multidrug resistance efflux pump